ncbi:sacsin N-terminal ATP-binding-like domain-containing protein [Haloimpatiens massiliensis]|nr:ATP-binding protein [Haloimpatiens massiliensis]
MIRDTILQINKKFLEEGKNSPQLFEDLAQLEHYIAESYGNRVLIELLQNADDAKSTKSYLYYDGKNLYFANNGKPFDESDIISISRAGSSNKDRKQMIGYRGVGFKSTTFLTSDIIIFSNNESFTFSKSKSEEILRGFGINKCPTVRIPFLVEGNMDSSILDIV